MNRFFLRKPGKFIIYGAGILGREVMESLLSHGAHVECFFDRNAGNIGHAGSLPVYAPEAFAPAGKSEYVVFIAVSQYFDHEPLALRLHALGFENILYKKDIVLNEQRHAVNRIYDAILDGHVPWGEAVEVYTPGGVPFLRDASLISDAGCGSPIVHIPYTLLYACRPENPELYAEHTKFITFDEALYGNRNEPFFFKAESGLYSHFLDETASGLEDYCRVNMGIKAAYPSDADRGGILDKTMSIFSRMSVACSLDSGFFARHPVEAKWVRDKYFALINGMHRASFLYAHGRLYIPCRISGEDRRAWIHAPALESVAKFIEDAGLSSLPTPVCHPYFYLAPCRAEAHHKNSFMRVCSYLKSNGIRIPGKRVLVCQSGIGYLSQLFHKMGAEVTAVEKDAGDHALSLLLDELLYCRGIRSLNDDWRLAGMGGAPYDIVFHIDYAGAPKAASRAEKKRLDELTGSLLFYDSPTLEDFDDFLRSTGFTACLPLGRIFRHGETRFLAALTKER